MIAEIVVLLSMVKSFTVLPPITNLVISDRLLPLIVIGILLPPLFGKKDSSLGGLVENPDNAAIPPVVLTLTKPG